MKGKHLNFDVHIFDKAGISSEHSPEDAALYKEPAAQFNLVETGGTDCHGDNKPAIHLGTGKGNNVHTTYELLENMRQGVGLMAAG